MKVLHVILSLALAAAFAVSESQAQSIGPWVGYGPATAWSPPAVTYVPAPAAPAAPATVGTGWQGYAPATAWQPYQPQAAWTGYAPQAGWGTVRQAARPSGGKAPISSRNREYGTGRNVAMHKPWLPASPR